MVSSNNYSAKLWKIFKFVGNETRASDEKIRDTVMIQKFAKKQYTDKVTLQVSDTNINRLNFFIILSNC